MQSLLNIYSHSAKWMHAFLLVIVSLGCESSPSPADARTEVLTEVAMDSFYYGRSYEQTKEQFEELLNEDSTNATAYAMLPILYYLTLPFDSTAQLVHSAVENALVHGPELAASHVADGFVKKTFDQDIDGAREAFEYALELDPNYSEAHREMAWFLLKPGTLREALSAGQKAHELVPDAPGTQANLAVFLRLNGMHEVAIEHAEAVLGKRPDLVNMYYNIAIMHIVLGNYENALEVINRGLNQQPDAVLLKNVRVWALSYTGKNEDARKTLEDLNTPGLKALVDAFEGELEGAEEGIEELETLIESGQWGWSNMITEIHLLLGNTEEAVAWFERGYQDRKADPTALVEYGWFWANISAFDEFREDPRVRTILDEIWPG